MITRYRKTVNSEEKSILDYFIVCKRFYSLVKSLIIDEERAYSLTKYSGRTGNRSIKESDHNTLIMELDINWSSSTNDNGKRVEIFNFKNEEHFNKFVKLSENNDVFKSLFIDEGENLEVSAQI